jgi:hypothetical protein
MKTLALFYAGTIIAAFATFARAQEAPVPAP